MNEPDFQIRTQSDGILRLDQAVLIYRGASDRALATVHQVEAVDGKPVDDQHVEGEEGEREQRVGGQEQEPRDRVHHRGCRAHRTGRAMAALRAHLV